MSTFDIQSIAPEGYEVVGYGKPVIGEVFLSVSGEAKLAVFDFERHMHLILRKKWTPKVGEVIAVCDDVYTNWEFRQFRRFVDGDALCETPEGNGYYWEQYRKLTPEERGEC